MEIIHQPYFKPVITAPGRLDALIGLLNDTLCARAGTSDLAIVDFGTGQPPYTTMDVAAHFLHATVDGIDLYSPTHMVSRSDGAYALYEGGRLAAVHSASARVLHAMVLDWDATRRAFDRLLAEPEAGAKVVPDPTAALANLCPNRCVKLHRGRIGTFHLPSALHPGPEWPCALGFPGCGQGNVMEGYTSPSGSHAVSEGLQG